MQNKILIIDDEKDVVNLLCDTLYRNGYQNIQKAHCGKDAIKLCRDFDPDVIVLDIMLPDMDGFEVCKQIRQFSHCPVIFLSSKNDEVDKILGLAIGGDDYVTKPFSPREVVFRLKAQLRRLEYMQSQRQIGEGQTITIGPLMIDADASRAYKDGRELELTAREYGILLYLAQNADKIIGKERLYEQVWGEDSEGSDNTMMVHIRHLREKMEDNPSDPQLLVTVKGLGYRLVKHHG